MIVWPVLTLCACAAAAFILWPLRRQHIQCAFITGGVIGVSLGLYSAIGAPRLLPELAEYNAHMDALDVEITRLNARITTSTEETGDWAALGFAQMQRGNYAASAQAYKKAVLLSKGDPDLILEYAKAQILEAGGKITDAARKGLSVVHEMQPDNPEAQYFLAMADVQDGKIQEAMPVFKKLYRTLPEDSPVRQLIGRQIGAQ